MKEIVRMQKIKGATKQLENQARLRVLRVLWLSTTVLIGLFFLLLMVSYFLADNRHIAARLIINFIALIYLLFIGALISRNKYRAGSVFLVAFYIVISSGALWVWGVNIPFALMMMSITITLAGILLGVKYSLYVAITEGFIVLFLQLITTLQIHLSDYSWQTDSPSKFGEALGTCLLFAILAIVSWMFGRQTEEALLQARQAEAALIDQKKLLAIKLKERTEKLRLAQLKEMQQLYRFAELGQLSTALFHELANHLSVLTLDLEDLKKKKRTRTLEGAKDSITYIERLVSEVSRQLHHDENPRYFDPLIILKEVASNLKPRFDKSTTNLVIDDAGWNESVRIYGDPTRFGQIMTILIINALEATMSPVANISQAPSKRQVIARVLFTNEVIKIDIQDWGEGVQPAISKKIFEPFYGTKNNGMGIGLFITKQIMETHFKGSIAVTRLRKPTQFTIVVPRASN